MRSSELAKECGVSVLALRCDDDGPRFVADISDGTIKAENVVVATGPYQRPAIPPLLRDNTHLFQVHASEYRNLAKSLAYGDAYAAFLDTSPTPNNLPECILLGCLG
jgi:cation diffusion facilitator CzcD-associated flavoprotein CzcO